MKNALKFNYSVRCTEKEVRAMNHLISNAAAIKTALLYTINIAKEAPYYADGVEAVLQLVISLLSELEKRSSNTTHDEAELKLVMSLMYEIEKRNSID